MGYLATWQIDIFDARTPVQAARQALNAMQRTDSIARVFTIESQEGGHFVVDLGEESCRRAHCCDNCRRVIRRRDLVYVWPEIPDVLERISPGNPVPSGQCPHCGALTYLIYL